jgi:hypothetical protein
MLDTGPNKIYRYLTLSNMADESVENDIKILKNSKILVNIEEALDDVILVSFTHQSKVFQGALLNSTKK